jgi:putative transposase
MRYRRADAPGGTFFFAVNLANRSSRLLTGHIDLLRDGVRDVRRAHPFTIVAMVVLPDHLHAIWTLPAGDGDYALRWALIKAGFSRRLEKTDPVSEARRRKRERGIWQRRYWEHQLRDEADLARHVDYIHINPVKHGHAGTPVEWPYSSIHRYIRQGILPPDWAIDWGQSGSGFGE